MSWSVLPLTGNHRGDAFPLHPLPFTIGRGRSAQLRPKSPAVAEAHCTLSEQDGLLVVEDHATETGTFLDGHPVVTPSYVGGSSVLQVGPLFFKLCWSEDPTDDMRSIEERVGAMLAE